MFKKMLLASVATVALALMGTGVASAHDYCHPHYRAGYGGYHAGYGDYHAGYGGYSAYRYAPGVGYYGGYSAFRPVYPVVAPYPVGGIGVGGIGLGVGGGYYGGFGAPYGVARPGISVYLGR